MGRQTERQIEGLTVGQRDTQTEGQTYRWTERHTNRLADIQKNRQTEGQTDNREVIPMCQSAYTSEKTTTKKTTNKYMTYDTVRIQPSKDDAQFIVRLLSAHLTHRSYILNHKVYFETTTVVLLL